MSTVTVQLYASYAENLGATTLQISLGPVSTVGEVVESIRSLPGGHMLPEFPRVAVNQNLASPDQVIDSFDEVALIPPVAGG